MADLSPWLRQARAQWKYRGQERPPFAEPTSEGQESVWDYPRPPRLAPDQRTVIVKSGGEIIAETKQSIRVLETASPPTFYLPQSDVRMDWLRQTPQGSICEWKGQATYWSVVVPQRPPQSNVGWSYDDPFAGFEPIAGYISFYPAALECYVDGVRVTPQPGNLYGGWVTPEVIGPFKGNAGTSGW